MNVTISICIVCLALTATGASAQTAEVQARWDDCYADGGAVSKTSACDSDVGAHRLVVSYTSPYTLTGFVAIDGWIDLQADDASIPPWWELKWNGACRPTAAGISIDASTLSNYSGACADTWDSGASATALFTGYGIDFGGFPGRARAVFAIARSMSNPTTVQSGTNYFAWIWEISNENTSACVGCLDPIALVVTGILLHQVSNGDVFLHPDLDTIDEACATWQNGTSCASVPTRNVTWGNVKARYR